MNNLILANPLENLTRIEYHGQRVLTTAQLADFYETKKLNLVSNFRNNSDRFVEGKPFFKVEGEELNTFKDIIKNFNVVPKNAARILLWMKRSCARQKRRHG